MVERFPPSEEVNTAYTCTLAPGAVKDYSAIVGAMELGVARHPNICRYRHPLGRILYRSGRPAEAVRELHEAIRRHPGQELAQDRLFLAMARLRQEKYAEARQDLEKAAELAKKALPAAGQPALSLEQRVEVELLQREARALLETLRR
jgi:tetratricopeptide (TPR) repeat protein